MLICQISLSYASGWNSARSGKHPGAFHAYPKYRLIRLPIPPIFARMKDDDKRKIVASNRKARHDYEIIETFEAGIELIGSEVKSLRDSKVSFKDSFAQIKNGQVILLNLHISPYEKASHYSHEPERKRRLLLHKREIRKLFQATEIQGLSLVPLSIYFAGPYAKVELALAKGRRKYDKRAAIAERDAKMDISRSYRQKQ
jgi:SsrA-binding protein